MLSKFANYHTDFHVIFKSFIDQKNKITTSILSMYVITLISNFSINLGRSLCEGVK